MKHDDIDRRLLRLCGLVRAGALAGAAFALVVPVGLWVDPEWARSLGTAMAGLDCERVTVEARTQVIGAAVSVLPAALGVALCVALWQLFGEYAAGRALTAPAQRLLQRLAWLLLAIALLRPLLRAGYSTVMTLANPPGQRLVVLGVSSDDYLMAIVALALLAIATVMRQAVRAAEENRDFV